MIMSFMWKDFHDVGIHLDTFSEEAYKRSLLVDIIMLVLI